MIADYLVSANWWAIVGLLCDSTGFSILALDLVATQREASRASSANERTEAIVKDMNASISAAMSSPTPTKQGSVFIGGVDFEANRVSAAHEHTMTRRIVLAVGAALEKLDKEQQSRSEGSSKSASRSLKFSNVGIALVLFGAALQIVGSL